jgi:hypothetical protein
MGRRTAIRVKGGPHVKRKVGKKLELSKETVRVLDEKNLLEAMGAFTGTVVCSGCRTCTADEPIA